MLCDKGKPKRVRTVLCSILGVCLFLVTIGQEGALAASLTGSKHDLSSEGAPQLCLECHIPHYSEERAIYIRDLIPDANSVDALCLDCHDPNREIRPSTPAPPAWASKAADVSGLIVSRHDFSSRTWARRGACYACHELHDPDPTHSAYVGSGGGHYITNDLLWVRTLNEELENSTDFYQKRDLATESADDKPNFLVGRTILCYDCHSGSADANPNYSTDFVNPAQDVAFGSNMTDGKGYYELGDGTVPSATNKAPTLDSVLAGVSPGGHFVKSIMADATSNDNYEVRDPDGTLLYRISVGDKLPCELCHDPHRGETATVDEVFFRRDIHAGEGTILVRTTDPFTGKLNASKECRNGNGTQGDGRLMCQYCHGSSDWDGNVNPIVGISPLILETSPRILTLFGIRVRTPVSPPTGASSAIPPPNTVEAHKKDPGAIGPSDDPPCSACHLHNDMGSANCGSCHEYPPSRGAHAKHQRSQLTGGVRMECDVCHGQGAQSAAHFGHPTDNRAIVPANIDLLGSAVYGTTRPSWYNSTWYSASLGATDVTYTSLDSFTCVNVRCHGGDSVKWEEKADSATYNDVCYNCHDSTVSSFQLPNEATTVYSATNAATNYKGPFSGFSRGGHGDVAINDSSWFRDTAPGSAVPLACVACHDETQPHFGIAAVKPSNPYRVSDTALANNLPGRDTRETRLSNLCTQTSCHPKFLGTGDFAFLALPKHPSDQWPISNPRAMYVSSGSANINNQSAGSSTTDPHYDPVGVSANGDPAVGLHIDRYQDHWEWWNPSFPATPTDADDVPFLPLGDSLSKSSGGSYDNTTTTLVTCITCHNPHGTDLYVSGQVPGSASTFVEIPANKMLRLRDQDDELCNACH